MRRRHEVEEREEHDERVEREERRRASGTATTRPRAPVEAP
jgi:hypothetical protein